MTQPKKTAQWNPTPDEIKAACAEIRAGWSPFTEEGRRMRVEGVGTKLVTSHVREPVE